MPRQKVHAAGATNLRSDRHRTDLLQEGQQVRLPAFFDNFPAGNAIEVHGLNKSGTQCGQFRPVDHMLQFVDNCSPDNPSNHKARC
jgi:hypothetical protein